MTERAGRFRVNVLTYAQREISAVFGTAGADRFAAVPWWPAPSGAPVLDGVPTWIDCVVPAVHEAGDHYVVTGRVTALGEHRDERPLLFYRGGCTATEPAMPATGPAGRSRHLVAARRLDLIPPIGGRRAPRDRYVDHSWVTT